MHDWCLNVQSGMPTNAVYFDFKKALDLVVHSKLSIKLPAYGMNGNLFTWISDFLHNGLKVVKMNNTYSHSVKLADGVPQGIVLGPTLFLLFTNDVSSTLDDLDVKHKLFADDIKLYPTYDLRGSKSDLAAVDRL